MLSKYRVSIVAAAAIMALAAIFLFGFPSQPGSMARSVESNGGAQDTPKFDQPQKTELKQPADEVPQTGIISGASYKNDTSPALRDIKPVPYGGDDKEREASPNPSRPVYHLDVPDPVVEDKLTAVQNLFFPAIPSPILNFDGILFPGVGCNCAPPDTDGEVGQTQFVQMVNEGIQVFNKSTGAPLGPAIGIATIWTGFGGVCQTNGNGDPIVLYDQLANRWVISQFAGSGVPTDECIAISTTNDATGTYNRYAFHLGSNFFDYPHIAVWPDGYYMSDNVFNSGGTAFLGPQAFAFDRISMLAGLPATFVSPGVTGGPAEDSYLPADLDGSTLPPAGAPASFVEAPFTNTYRVFHFHADFTTPANSTFTLFASPAAAGFTELCPGGRACVPQLGGSGSNGVDGIGDRLMFRLATRFIGGHESTVGNLSVSAGGVAGIRWFELRGITSGPVTVFQESTYQPDTTWRWMGSAAMDNQGNMALGYSASSATINPQIRYAGRLATDPINTLGQGENTLFAGTGSQTGTGNRWGDYSDLTVDPVDDCTFWYTQEYYSTTATFSWRTRIGSFKFPNCLASGQGTAHFIVTSCNTSGVLVGGAVSVDGNALGFTDSGGMIDIGLNPGSHTYSISKIGFGTVSGNFNISGSTTTNVSTCLTGVAVLGISGAPTVTTGNGIIEPNECNSVNIPLTNSGSVNATVVSAVLSTTTSGVNITQPNSAYPNIAAGATQTNTTPYQVSTSNAVACFSSVNLTLTVTYTGGGSPAVLNFTVPVGQAASASYTFASTTGTIPAGGTLVAGSQADDAAVSIPLPSGFASTVYGTTVTSLSASTNGALSVNAPTSNAFTNTALPSSSFPATPTLFPYWDDLDMSSTSVSNGGIYTNTTGAAPNRQFIIEWRAVHFGDAGTTINTNFAIVLTEGSDAIRYIYAQTGVGANLNGASATVGVQPTNTGTDFTQFSFNTPSLTAGLQLTGTRAPGVCAQGSGPCAVGGTPTPTPTPTVTPTPTATPTPTPTPTPVPTCDRTGVLGTAPTGGTTGVLATRLFRGQVVGTCGINAIPANTGTGPYIYNTHRYTNSTSSPVCVTVTLTNMSPTANLQVAAFTAPFTAPDITNPAKYLGDPGTSSGSPPAVTMFQATIPANTSFDLVVFSVNVSPLDQGAPYTLSVSPIGLCPAAAVTVGGRVFTADGRGLRNGTVTINGPNGYVSQATTSSFGFYSFPDVVPGQTYTIGVFSRFFRFQPRTLMVTGDLSNVDFNGQE